jgi:hypothetical protein
MADPRAWRKLPGAVGEVCMAHGVLAVGAMRPRWRGGFRQVHGVLSGMTDGDGAQGRRVGRATQDWSRTTYRCAGSAFWHWLTLHGVSPELLRRPVGSRCQVPGACTGAWGPTWAFQCGPAQVGLAPRWAGFCWGLSAGDLGAYSTGLLTLHGVSSAHTAVFAAATRRLFNRKCAPGRDPQCTCGWTCLPARKPGRVGRRVRMASYS